MDVKEDDLCKNLLCYACLCVGRNVYEISDQNLKKYYFEVLDEIPLIKSNNFTNYAVCWECRAVLQKCCAFREQVKDSYRILQSYTSENLYESLLTNIARLPRLNIHNTEAVDINPCEQNNYEIPIIKAEVNDWNCNEDATNIKDNLSEDDSDNIKEDLPTIESELKTIVSSMKREDKRKSKRKKCKKNLKEKSVVQGSCEAIDLPEVNLNKDEGSWDCGDHDIPPLEESYLSDTYNAEEQLNADYSSIFCSIGEENGEKGSKRSQKSVKILGKKSLPQKYAKNVRTVELSYEEMLLERENECKRDAYITCEYKCETCLIGFYYKKSYQAHMDSKHNPNIGNYICPICKTRIASVDSFSSHYRRHTRRYECTICLKRTIDLKVMQQHYFSTHDISLKQYKCNVCGQMSNSIDSHRYHKDSHKGRLQCPDCEKTFRHRAGLMNHRLAVHEFHNAFPCTICDKVFRWKTSLKRHLEKHDSKNKSSTLPYCSSCNIEFASICSYQRHMKNSLKHVSQDQLKFICDHCNRRFSDKTKLRDHIEEKHLHKTFQCHICLKPSKNRVGLDQHIRNVHKGRPKNKICHHCGRGFPTKMQLESHIRTHTGERPFICEYCPSTFSHQSNLYKHNKQVHLNIKSKRYPICKKRKEDTDPVGKVPIIDSTVDNDPFRPVVLQYSPERGFVL